MKVSWDDDIPNIWKNKKCSKPPISTNSTSNRYRVLSLLGPMHQQLASFDVHRPRGLSAVQVSHATDFHGQSINRSEGAWPFGRCCQLSLTTALCVVDDLSSAGCNT